LPGVHVDGLINSYTSTQSRIEFVDLNCILGRVRRLNAVQSGMLLQTSFYLASLPASRTVNILILGWTK
jgi:hypothetical protein